MDKCCHLICLMWHTPRTNNIIIPYLYYISSSSIIFCDYKSRLNYTACNSTNAYAATKSNSRGSVEVLLYGRQIYILYVPHLLKDSIISTKSNATEKQNFQISSRSLALQWYTCNYYNYKYTIVKPNFQMNPENFLLPSITLLPNGPNLLQLTLINPYIK